MIILASSSPIRKELLNRLQIPFETITSDVEETIQENESAERLVKRLSLEKAQAVANEHPQSWIIGCDTVATLKDGQMFGKPGDFHHAKEQLMSFSQQPVRFLSGLCLINNEKNITHVMAEPFTVHFKQLSESTISRYLNQEEPYHCCGSFKSEGLGITLVERFEGSDPNSLMGLPLIKLTQLLAREGLLTI